MHCQCGASGGTSGHHPRRYAIVHEGRFSGQVLLAWEDNERLVDGLRSARFTPTILAGVRRRGWAQSLGEREPGVASVSAPVRGQSGRVIAALSMSGPIERLTRQPGKIHHEAVVQTADELSELLRVQEDAPAY